MSCGCANCEDREPGFGSWLSSIQHALAPVAEVAATAMGQPEIAAAIAAKEAAYKQQGMSDAQAKAAAQAAVAQQTANTGTLTTNQALMIGVGILLAVVLIFRQSGNSGPPIVIAPK